MSQHLLCALNPRTWLEELEFKLLDELDHVGGVEVIGRVLLDALETLDVRGLVVIEEYRWPLGEPPNAYAYINEAGLVRLKYERAVRKIRRRPT